ncbi:DUF6527 family protein [Bradyrhizobium sp. WSM471]|uniref:DUF6527 family protein n=1 Tax=Bradyrhizobium sp. WSM471 TaxID=319017 RepID=UPI00024D3723|nr:MULTISPECIES: DUF6527 family protein [Bradyrhizobium]EHR05618.1 hypothetical protein Bra471DRAFT_06443 [Bradyrhizobium sp. WSM471]UFW40713.1 hypothetical protein BcanWSM471_31625 [Bradyrhizobium canariense]
MIRYKKLEHRFVEHIPECLQPGILYVSTKYATSAHSCCCGCGEEVVAPFTPTDWKMTFDGETISLRPSIGNWTLKCRSHYVIDRGKVIEAGPWSDEQVEAERRRDSAAKARFYGQPPQAEHPPQPAQPKATPSIWRRAWHWVWGR